MSGFKNQFSSGGPGSSTADPSVYSSLKAKAIMNKTTPNLNQTTHSFSDEINRPGTTSNLNTQSLALGNPSQMIEVLSQGNLTTNSVNLGQRARGHTTMSNRHQKAKSPLKQSQG